MAFAENLKKCREEKGLSQAELANQVNIAQSMIAQYEKGLKVPTILTGVELAKKLGTTCEALVSDRKGELLQIIAQMSENDRKKLLEIAKILIDNR